MLNPKHSICLAQGVDTVLHAIGEGVTLLAPGSHTHSGGAWLGSIGGANLVQLRPSVVPGSPREIRKCQETQGGPDCRRPHTAQPTSSADRDCIVICPVLARGSHQPLGCYVRALGGVFMPNNSKRPGGHHDNVTCFEGGDPERTP